MPVAVAPSTSSSFARLPADDFDDFVDDVTTRIRQSLGLPYERRPPILEHLDDTFAPPPLQQPESIYPPRPESSPPRTDLPSHPSPARSSPPLAPSPSPDRSPSPARAQQEQDAISIGSSSVDQDDQDDEDSIIDETPIEGRGIEREGTRVESGIEISDTEEEDADEEPRTIRPPSSQRRRRTSDQRYHDSDEEVDQLSEQPEDADEQVQLVPGDEVESESEQEMADHFGDALPEPSQLRGADSLGRIRHTLDREAEGEMYDEEEDALVEDRALIVDEQDRQRVRSAGKRPSTEDEADAQAEADYFDDEAEGAVDVDVEPNYDADGYLDEPAADPIASIYPPLPHVEEAEQPPPLDTPAMASFDQFIANASSPPSDLSTALDPALLAAFAQPPKPPSEHEHYAQHWRHVADATEQADEAPQPISAGRAEPDEVDVEAYEHDETPRTCQPRTPPVLVEADTVEDLDATSTREGSIDLLAPLETFSSRPTPAEAFAGLRSNARHAAEEEAKSAPSATFDLLTPSLPSYRQLPDSLPEVAAPPSSAELAPLLPSAPASPLSGIIPQPPSPPLPASRPETLTDVLPSEQSRLSPPAELHLEALEPTSSINEATVELVPEEMSVDDIEVRSGVSEREVVDEEMRGESVQESREASLAVESIIDVDAEDPQVLAIDADEAEAGEQAEGAELSKPTIDVDEMEEAASPPFEKPASQASALHDLLDYESETTPVAAVEEHDLTAEDDSAPIDLLSPPVEQHATPATQIGAVPTFVDEQIAPVGTVPDTDLWEEENEGASEGIDAAGAIDSQRYDEALVDTEPGTEEIVETAESADKLDQSVDQAVSSIASPTMNSDAVEVVDESLQPIDAPIEADELQPELESMDAVEDPKVVEEEAVDPAERFETDVPFEAEVADQAVEEDASQPRIDAAFEASPLDGEQAGDMSADGEEVQMAAENDEQAVDVMDEEERAVEVLDEHEQAFDAMSGGEAEKPHVEPLQDANIEVLNADEQTVDAVEPEEVADVVVDASEAMNDADYVPFGSDDGEDAPIEKPLSPRRPNVLAPGEWHEGEPIIFGGDSLEAAVREAAFDPERSADLRAGLGFDEEDMADEAAAQDVKVASDASTEIELSDNEDIDVANLLPVRISPHSCSASAARPSAQTRSDLTNDAASPPPSYAPAAPEASTSQLPAEELEGRVTRSRTRKSLRGYDSTATTDVEESMLQQRRSGRRGSSVSRTTDIASALDADEDDYELVEKPSASEMAQGERGKGRKRRSGKGSRRSVKVEPEVVVELPTTPPLRSRQISNGSDASSVAGQLVPSSKRKRKAVSDPTYRPPAGEKDGDEEDVATELTGQPAPKRSNPSPRSSPIRPRLHHHKHSSYNTASYRPPSPVKRTSSETYSPPRTRSQCTYRKLAVPSSTSTSEYIFLVPGCSTADKEDALWEEEVRDLGEATEREQGEAIALATAEDAHAIDAAALNSLTRIVGLDILHEGQCELLGTRPSASFAVVVPEAGKRKRAGEDDETDGPKAKRKKGSSFWKPSSWW